ncbi:MAG: hybrid sensor histidine kinase/response regulator [Gammaproteobacteria bacterium]|nr:hybrid sensor histidine kinase/response regulator [Gammaproteobacteria bacterium]
MELSPEVLKKLLETFQTELDESLQIIVDGLLLIEKNDKPIEESKPIIEKIFRSAHNIKGAARGIGVNDVADIAHQIESIFSRIQKELVKVSPKIIDICLEAVDAMRFSMQSYLEKKPLEFNIQDLLSRMQLDNSDETEIVNQVVQQAPAKTNQPFKKEHETIRVSLNSLDQISSLMEEMQVNKIAIDDYYISLSKLSAKAKQFVDLWKKTFLNNISIDGKNSSDSIHKTFNMSMDSLLDINESIQQLQKNMRPRVNELSILSNSLQEEIRMLRLVPITTLLSSFPRLIRDLSKELNKNIELEIIGDEVKMDKMVLEGLKDPLIHLLRNAIDHGIESSTERKAAGKSEIGHITINISEEGNQIVFNVTDDGAGINIDKISKIAVNKKMILPSELENMNRMEILSLIFKSGFSTAQTITDVSGRGVGLDIVKSNIDALNGNVVIETELGKSTSFIIRVPLTLASERGLVINVSGEIYVVPVTSVERVLMLQPKDIIEVEASQVILFNNHPVPLRALADILDLKKNESINQMKLPIIVLKKGWNTVALLVDEIIGEREIVIKPMQAPLVNVACVSGGTLSGNGQVILVLNVNDLINYALHTDKMTRLILKDQKVETRLMPRILVVDDSITTRTLERNVLESKGYQVTVAVNGKEAWDLLQKEKYSLVITDVSMPIMDEFTLTERIKQSNEFNDLPVIIVTSLGSDSEKKRGIESGANAYIVKNEFESSALLEIVSQLV